MPPKQKLLVLISKGVSDRTQASNQRRAITILDSKGIPYETIDGMDPDQRDRRNELFGISGVRGNYPQFFLVQMDNDGGENGVTSYLGDWGKLEEINDTSTWNEVFASVIS
mmetsp:Transcript_17367/g.25489  ORF Transcript_17367/g.25489 Transcript_17367/m.25489 type:complete len:111 (+) Transcript_17367:106-438(+)